MSNRTYGETRNCAGCRYWSEMIAKSEGGGPVQAMCLGKGPRNSRYTSTGQDCSAWQSGHFGAVDQPGVDDPYAGEAVEG